MFNFSGEISSSKSIMNRALIVKSYFPELAIVGSSLADDVVLLQEALTSLSKMAIEFNAGAGGTTFRFLVLRLSREVGTFKVKISQRLSQRPLLELIEILSQLGVKATLLANEFVIESKGWRFDSSQVIRVDSSQSSQFVSSLLLNSLNLNFDFYFETQTEISSASYFELTLKMLEYLGFKIEKETKGSWSRYLLRSNQKIAKDLFVVEPDMSSIFTMSCAAALGGSLSIKSIPQSSLQPDFRGIELLGMMGAKVRFEAGLCVEKAENLLALQCSLEQSPDLFPCLAVVCAFANGISELRGGKVLQFKESNRLLKTSELLSLVGIQNEILADGLRISGRRNLKMEAENTKGVSFDPDHDHRLAFAAGLLKLKGFKIKILEPEVVKKSFPEFWQILGVQP